MWKLIYCSNSLPCISTSVVVNALSEHTGVIDDRSMNNLMSCICDELVSLHRSYVFRAQSQEIKERGGNQSTGIDFFITQERVIFLDTQVRMKFCRKSDNRSLSWQNKIEAAVITSVLPFQPMLSPSILDHLINNDRKLPPEYNLPHTYVEMQVSGWPAEGTGDKTVVLLMLACTWRQINYFICLHLLFFFHAPKHITVYLTISQQSLQIAAFLFTVCHVVIVVQDWFTDLNVYRYVLARVSLAATCCYVFFHHDLGSKVPPATGMCGISAFTSRGYLSTAFSSFP